jgi:hypothetical protein
MITARSIPEGEYRRQQCKKFMELMGHFADALDLKLVDINSGLTMIEKEAGPGKVQTLFVSFGLQLKK